ncbi:MAG: repressor LexA [Anaerolineaceae bacterium]|nr:repressor LexA [Anaerolineaceae bacterium]
MAPKKEFHKLSDRQRGILRYMESYIDANGFPPTIREIGEATDINSTSVVNYNLNKLVKAGYLARSSHVSRGLRLIAEIPGGRRKSKKVGVAPQLGLGVPLAGYIFASEPVQVMDDFDQREEQVEVTAAMLGGFDVSEVFALKVRGDSMIDAMIQEGDIVLFHSQETARNGDMVAVWLSDRSETTLKYFHKEDSNTIRLQPAHPTMKPIYVDAEYCQIQGKVLSVIRQI